MYNMCHFCGADLTEAKQCNNKRENGSLELNGGAPIGCCDLCKEKQVEESIKRDGSSSEATSMISPVSLSSSESFASSCSDFSVDGNSYLRSNQEDDGTVDSGQEDLNFRLNGHLQNSSSTNARGGARSSRVMEKKDNIDGDLAYKARDVENIITDDDQEQRVDALQSAGGLYEVENQGSDASHSLDNELEPQLWEPPEPEDLDDDVEGSVANFDDDEECGDGTRWGKPISLSRFGEEGGRSYSFKEEKQRAMEEVMTGKFKALVGQLLQSVGVPLTEEDNKSWVDVVTSLSWEAASFVKPDAVESKAMDPDGYVKVKCIASGSRSQSQVIKGLVFKKHAAHKHMPTKYKNPKLLLIRGMLGQSSSGLSSFDLMEQERNNLNSVIEMIEICHPNLVLVEKSVSRDVQELILKKGMTLVFDMKLHRLKRVARFTGSPILSSEALMGQKLKQCDDFHFEKFIEEHAASVEGGKRPSKTLMFLEGCPTRLGCTILLKGSPSDELKKIKCVVQCAFVMAYHLILETSFLADRKAMFCTTPFVGMRCILPNGDQSSFIGPVTSSVSCLDESTGKHPSSSTLEIPISGSENLSLGMETNSLLFSEPYNPDEFPALSSLQASLKKVIGESFSRSSTPYQSLSSYFGLNGRELDGQISSDALVLTSREGFQHSVLEAKCNSDEEKPTDSEQIPRSLSVSCEVPEGTRKIGACNEDTLQNKDDMGTVLDSQSILVLMSSRNASRGTICEQIHFSHIKFYKNFDVPLGKFLRDNLLSQRNQCMICGEPSEAHFYYYAHHKKQLTIQVKRLLPEKRLPGEAEGKLWMWSCCGKCKPENGSTKSTKRVLISTATRGLSFGKFLEMSFSPGSSFKASSCGHSLDEDFLYFFGSGLMVAMFRYSPVVTFTVSMPPQKLKSSISTRRGWLDEEIEHVHKKGISLFMEVENSLQTIGSRFGGSTLNLVGPKYFAQIEDMLRLERSEFEVNIQSVKNGNSTKTVYKLLSLNRLLWELLLESCVWDRRLHLLSSNSAMVNTSSLDRVTQGQFNFKEDNIVSRATDRVENNFDIPDDSAEVKLKREESLEENEFPLQEIPVDGLFQGLEGKDDLLRVSTKVQGIEGPGVVNLGPSGVADQNTLVRHHAFANPHSGAENCTGGNFPLTGHLEADKTIPVIVDLGKSSSSVDLSSSQRGSSLSLLLSDIENSKEYVWTPFREILNDCTKDIHNGYIPRFEPVSGRTSEFLPSVHRLISEEGSRLHIHLNIDDLMVLDFEDELSSIIACALAVLMNSAVLTEYLGGDTRKEKGMAVKTTESSHGIPRVASMTSLHSSTASLDSDGAHSAPAVSSEESRFSSFDGFNLLNSLVSFGALHPEVSLGVGKLPGKGKYSVVSLYDNQFRDLRNRCCPSELDYIASLSRCKNWDAKGGKSKSFFAKTLDDRLIIKEIKKTEFDSFMKFAPDYFEYMNHSFDSGSQTCLAKILGIYQLKLMKSGKEVKRDLMVMENLTFGRNIARQYDLKGALHARFSAAADGSGDVFLDQNFVNDMNTSPLYVSNKAKRLLQRAVWNDTTFLTSINVMDYSLLVGVDRQHRVLVCGIIDYLRQYTWDKQLETWVKSSLVVPKHLMPTVVSPVEYKKRFRKFMSTHFLSVPDDWCSEKLSDPRDFCSTGK